MMSNPNSPSIDAQVVGRSVAAAQWQAVLQDVPRQCFGLVDTHFGARRAMLHQIEAIVSQIREPA